jgi:hypothetical protein
MKSVKYLEELKAKNGLKNDRQLALHLNLGTSTIHQYTSGKRVMDHEACLAVGLALGMDRMQAMEIIIAADIDRAEKAGQQSLWSRFSDRMAASAASAILAAGVTFILTPADAEAAQVKASSTAQNVDSLYYVKWLK